MSTVLSTQKLPLAFSHTKTPLYYTINFEKTIDYKIRRKRISILKDVLKQINVRNVEKGKYCEIFLNSQKKDLYNSDLKEKIKGNEKNCEVCALGSLFISKVKLYNEFVVKESDILEQYSIFRKPNYGIYINPKKIHKNLSQYFALEQLNLIESAFENIARYERVVNSYENFHRENNCLISVRMFESMSPKERLIAIVKNMLDNNGVLILTTNN